MKKVVLFSVLLLSVLSCGDSVGQNGTKDVNLKHYLAIKDALVATDGKTVQSEADAWLKEAPDSEMLELVERLSATEDVRIHRENFNELSQLMISRVEKNNPDIKLYKQYCPMAFFNRGAFWLSAEEKVMNPYFGELMLTCGEVQEVIKSDE